MEENKSLAVVCGRRKEQFPDLSVYNRLIDLEWDTPIGKTTFCGGDALMKVKAIKEVNGYNSSLICGEEPEMCIRLRRKGWEIERIDANMTLHDAAIYKFSQWWQRSVRGGWAVAQGFDMYGKSSEKYMVKQHLSGWLWAAIIPLLSFGLAWFTNGFSLLLLFGYPFLIYKIYLYRLSIGNEFSDSFLYAFWCVFSKFPQLIGQNKYWIQRFLGFQGGIIEYK